MNKDMKETNKFLGVILLGMATIALFGIAGVLLYEGIEDGWGWFLFAGILTASGVYGLAEDPEDPEDP